MLTANDAEVLCERLGFSEPHLLKEVQRGFYDETWDETVIDWDSMAKLIEKIKEYYNNENPDSQ